MKPEHFARLLAAALAAVDDQPLPVRIAVSLAMRAERHKIEDEARALEDAS